MFKTFFKFTQCKQLHCLILFFEIVNKDLFQAQSSTLKSDIFVVKDQISFHFKKSEGKCIQMIIYHIFKPTEITWARLHQL